MERKYKNLGNNATSIHIKKSTSYPTKFELTYRKNCTQTIYALEDNLNKEEASKRAIIYGRQLIPTKA